MFANGWTMVSMGIKSNEFPIKHLAKSFYFIFLSQIKRFGGLSKCTKTLG
ncbi:conserved hypothetical protein [Tenacibaculum halocynthiae]